MKEKAVVGTVTKAHGICLAGLRKITESPSRDRGTVDRKSKSRFPKYEAEILTT
jgi:hypothetical protein